MENLKHLKGCYEIQNFDNFFGHPKRGVQLPTSSFKPFRNRSENKKVIAILKQVF